MERLSRLLTEFLLRHDLITAEQVEWCRYTLFRRFFSLVMCGLLVILGTLIAGFWPALLFTGGQLFLNKRTNGYHAHTELGCILVSALFEAAAMLLLPKLFFELYLTLLFGGALCVCMLAPVNNGKIHLSPKELRAMRWRGWLRVLILIVASLALFYNGAFELAVSLALAIFFTAISLMLAVVGLGEQ